jgi:hypothetical protein
VSGGNEHVALAWEHQRDRLADALGRLRRRHDVYEYDRILADQAAASLDALDALLEPCVADLVRAGFDVDDALDLADRHVARLHARMGGRP